MINRQNLLSDLQSLLRTVEEDLRDRSDSDEVPEVGEWLRAEYAKAKKAERTAQTYDQWENDYITQVAAAWVLSCVFARFLEDNSLVDPPRIGGPGKRLERARDEHTLFFQDAERAKLTDREYLLDIFGGLAKSPVVKDVFGPHNPMNALPNWLGPDAAGELLRFFQKIDSDSGRLVHDFTDPPQQDGSGWDTRFLGDLYQDLSEAARKKYALLQTPEFVEEFILDRTLDPALDEFGLVVHHGDTESTEQEQENLSGLRVSVVKNRFKMIDPACGSGHFLLGAFPRILDRWQRQEPGTNVRVLVQKTLDSIHGVDINPFAIAIARFRLLLAALKACGITRLVDAPPFELNLACGDSLYHGRQRQLTLGDDWTDESHYFHTEDAEHLRRILKEGTFHCVVANPPYIVPRDKAANNAYRQLYSACHRQYSLSVPFMERIFRLAIVGQVEGKAAGYTGQITANSFMKREFGKKLIEDFFATVDLTHVVDTSGAFIPGHGTPTVTLFGRNRKPQAQTIRTVLGIRREPGVPEDAATGHVWLSILRQIDQPGSVSEFVSAADSLRKSFQKHPWSIGGGGASELKEQLTNAAESALSKQASVGVGVITGEDNCLICPKDNMVRRCRLSVRPMLIGDAVRDWIADPQDAVLWPNNEIGERLSHDAVIYHIGYLWNYRSNLRNRKLFSVPVEAKGLPWWALKEVYVDKLRSPLSIVCAFVATHNHFALDRGGTAFNRSAPVVKMSADATVDDHLALLGILNSSTACFWMKQTFQTKGSSGIGRGIYDEKWEFFYEFTGTGLERFPVPKDRPVALSAELNRHADEIVANAPNASLAPVCQRTTTRDSEELLAERLRQSRDRTESLRSRVCWLQEELDWQSYQVFGLIDEDMTSGVNVALKLGERSFEIVLARKVSRGETETSWFERHGSTPITELPDHWPDDYKRLVERRIEVIETNPQIALIEQPEYKRRWNTEPWDSQVERALKSWLLDRLESYFDFDGRMSEKDSPRRHGEEEKENSVDSVSPWLTPPLADIQLVSVAKLADIARQDEQFMEVAEVYRDDPAFDVQRLVEELVQGEHVPLLPVLRYKPNGLRNRAEWQKTWELQRLEDKLRAGEDVRLSDYELTDQQRDDIAQWQQSTPADQRADDRALDPILSIPVPPKYKSSDFISSGGARYWAQRGKLDVPKERWISFPHCEGEDGTLMICWAGYDHLQQAKAISAHFVDVQERVGGRDDPRLVPMLACLIELLPWLKQWHNEVDPEFGMAMGDYFEGFITEEARNLDMTVDEIKAWESPKKSKGRSVKRKAKV